MFRCFLYSTQAQHALNYLPIIFEAFLLSVSVERIQELFLGIWLLFGLFLNYFDCITFVLFAFPGTSLFIIDYSCAAAKFPPIPLCHPQIKRTIYSISHAHYD